MFGLALIVSGSCLVPTLAFHEYRINLDNNVDRTLDLSDLGVNLTSTFNQLLSPAGIVNQYALSILLQIMFIVGYVVSGLILAALKARYTEGPIVGILEYFDIHLSAQVRETYRDRPLNCHLIVSLLSTRWPGVCSVWCGSWCPESPPPSCSLGSLSR